MSLCSTATDNGPGETGGNLGIFTQGKPEYPPHSTRLVPRKMAMSTALIALALVVSGSMRTQMPADARPARGWNRGCPSWGCRDQP